MKNKNLWIAVTCVILITGVFLFLSHRQTSFTALDKKTYPISELTKHRLTALVFLAPGCPLCETYTSVLNELQRNYRDDDVQFFGIISGKLYSEEELILFRDSFTIEIPLLNDPDYILSKKYKADITPEVILLSDNEWIIYSGAIDDRAIGLTRLRSKISNHYLSDAIGSYLQNEPVKIKYTTAVGCFIE